jgi:hypothetical protein
MENMNKAELGFGNQTKSNRIKLNEITLDGQEGGFTYKKFLEPKGEDGFYPQEKLKVKEFEGVILAVRRKLQMYSDTDEKTYTTNEFNLNSEEITFYGSKGAEKGTADTLRKENPLLKTLAIVYFYSPKKDEMIRLNCKGLGLQPEESKAVNYKGLFQYLSSFGENQMPFQFYTKVSYEEKEVTKGRKTKTYYAMRFTQLEEVTDEKVKARIGELQKEVLSQFKKNEVIEEKKKESKIDDFTSDDIKYPEEEIDINNIPF